MKAIKSSPLNLSVKLGYCLIKGTEAQRVTLSVSHGHLNNFCNKWGTDGISETPEQENQTSSHWCFLVVMVLPNVKCVTHTRRRVWHSPSPGVS